MSLIPEQPLLFSPTLAATIGLEEAILLQVLDGWLREGETEERNGFRWLDVAQSRLEQRLPFWGVNDFRRICSSLRDKGIILIGGVPFGSSASLRYALNEQVNTPATPAAPPPAGTSPVAATARPAEQPPGARTISPIWQPDEELLRQLAQYNIPRQFAFDQVPEFVTYWNERGESRYSWGSRFIRHVLRLWREQESQDARRARELPMTSDWRPGADAIDILTRQSAISRNFVEDAIPEFVLYWRERGELCSTWDSRFVLHVKRQWARFTTALKTDSEPRPMVANWQPDPTVYEVLELANIDRQFAHELLPEFVLFWRDSGRVQSSWNTRFLQHVKRDWARRQNTLTTLEPIHGRPTRPHATGKTRERTLEQDLLDRSWAD